MGLKESSELGTLCDKAKMRIEAFFVKAASSTNWDLPVGLSSDIVAVINGNHKTFRYMLFTGLLVAVTDMKLHPRCLQKSAKIEGAFDARSLCQKVVVPFEKTYLAGRLGASNEPYVNKPARFEMVDLCNKVRKGADAEGLKHLYDALEVVRESAMELREKAFCFTLAQILKRPPSAASVVCTAPLRVDSIEHRSFFEFLDAHTGGASAVALLAAYFKILFGADAKIEAHPVNESGASSREVGDIDVEVEPGRRFAVEVKDKPYTRVDVMHACEKTLASGVKKLIFAVGPRGMKARVPEGALMDAWREKGLGLSFVAIEDLLGGFLCVQDEVGMEAMARATYDFLNMMKVSDAVSAEFNKAFNITK